MEVDEATPGDVHFACADDAVEHLAMARPFGDGGRDHGMGFARMGLLAAVLLVVAVALAGCGMGRAAQHTGELFDKYGCLAKEFKGENPCTPTQ